MERNKGFIPILIPLVVMGIVIVSAITYEVLQRTNKNRFPSSTSNVESLPINTQIPTSMTIPTNIPISKLTPTLIRRLSPTPILTSTSCRKRPECWDQGCKVGVDLKPGEILCTPTPTSTSIPFSEIKGCIMGVDVDFASDMQVNSSSDVETVFNKFIDDSKRNKKEIFGTHDPNYYKFLNATIHGTYKGKKYWRVTSQWKHTDPEDSFNYGKWFTEEGYDVSENGDVVRLLGCI